MAVKKTSLTSCLSDQELNQFSRLEKIIDEKLKKYSFNHSNTFIEIHFENSLSHQVRDLLKLVYKDAGWIVEFRKGGCLEENHDHVRFY